MKNSSDFNDSEQITSNEKESIMKTSLKFKPTGQFNPKPIDPHDLEEYCGNCGWVKGEHWGESCEGSYGAEHPDWRKAKGQFNPYVIHHDENCQCAKCWTCAKCNEIIHGIKCWSNRGPVHVTCRDK